jgi:transposase-like protein
MALLRYFKRKDDGLLPDPRGPLCGVVPSSSITCANAKVKAVLEADLKSSLTSSIASRGPYTKYTAEQRAQIGKRAAEEGVASTVRYFANKYPNLKESTVRDWRNAYRYDLKKRRSAGDDTAVKELTAKKTGRPLLIGEDLDKQVQAYLNYIRDDGGIVNTAMAISCAEGIVMCKDSNLLASNGGHIFLTKHWGKNTLHRMGLVKRKGTTKAKVSVEDFDVLKAQSLSDIKAVIEMEEIPIVYTKQV